MPRMSYDRSRFIAKNMGMVAGRLFDEDLNDDPEVKEAARALILDRKQAPGFFLTFNGKRHFGSITSLSDAYFGLTFYEVFKIAEGSGEFTETHKVFAKPNSPWDALMLVTTDFANHEAPDFRGVYGETAGDLRIASRDGLHWWMVNWTA